jgi:hypothetical protein
MKQVSFEKFKKWAISRFGEDQVQHKKGSTDELQLNSIFTEAHGMGEDTKFHMGISVSGGKKKRKYGVYHCFKTDERGSLIKLIQKVDGCSKKQAFITLFGNYTTIRDIEDEVDEFLNKTEKQFKIEIPKKKILKLPEGSYLINSLYKDDKFRIAAENHLNNRKIPIDKFLVCKKGSYYNRIIIPYYDQDGDIVYYNGRAIDSKYKRYKFPTVEEIGVGKGDVIYYAGDYQDWPKEGEEVYICEGEFNAEALSLCGLKSFACGGGSMSEKQAVMLYKYKIVFCFDNDKAGNNASEKMQRFVSPIRHYQQKGTIQTVKPPGNFNDWNQMLINLNSDIIYNYIMEKKKDLDYDTPFGSLL